MLKRSFFLSLLVTTAGTFCSDDAPMMERSETYTSASGQEIRAAASKQVDIDLQNNSDAAVWVVINKIIKSDNPEKPDQLEWEFSSGMLDEKPILAKLHGEGRRMIVIHDSVNQPMIAIYKNLTQAKDNKLTITNQLLDLSK